MAVKALEHVRFLGGNVVTTLDFFPLVSDCCRSLIFHNDCFQSTSILVTVRFQKIRESSIALTLVLLDGVSWPLHEEEALVKAELGSFGLTGGGID